MTAAAAALQEHSGCSEASAVATVSVLAAVAAIENPQQQQAAPATPLAGTSNNDGWSIITPTASSPATDANTVPLPAAALDETSWPPLRATALQQQHEAPAQEPAEAAAVGHPQQQQEALAQSPAAAAAAIEHVAKDFPGLVAAAAAAETGQPIEQLSQPLQQQLQQFSEGHQHAAGGTPPDAAMPTVTASPPQAPTPAAAAPELPVQQQQQQQQQQQDTTDNGAATAAAAAAAACGLGIQAVSTHTAGSADDGA